MILIPFQKDFPRITWNIFAWSVLENYWGAQAHPEGERILPPPYDWHLRCADCFHFNCGDLFVL